MNLDLTKILIEAWQNSDANEKLEPIITHQAKVEWGVETIVHFDRVGLKVRLTHADGRDRLFSQTSSAFLLETDGNKELDALSSIQKPSGPEKIQILPPKKIQHLTEIADTFNIAFEDTLQIYDTVQRHIEAAGDDGVVQAFRPRQTTIKLL
jgi:hypothetical protein